MKERINPDHIYYIKLGKKGQFEEDCINNGYLELNYHEVPHDLCLIGDFSAAVKYLGVDKTQGSLSNHARQVKTFYTASENDLWITFFKNEMWWCFSRPEIDRTENNTKRRRASWSNEDIQGNRLDFSHLSGNLLKTQEYRGTISEIKDTKDYLIRKINAEDTKQVSDAKQTFKSLKGSIKNLLQLLHPKDFEILIDLIFQRGGWRRTSTIGGTQKSIDLALELPITHEKAVVQIKSSAGRDEWDQFITNTESWSEYSKFFFVVHTPKNLENITKKDKYIYLDGDCIADSVMDLGLTNWIINKAT